METSENMQGQSAWERLKALKDKKINLSDKGKATLATGVVAPAIFEGAMSHSLPGNAGLGLSGGLILLSLLHGEKAFRVGRWLKEKFVEDNDFHQQHRKDESADERTPVKKLQDKIDNPKRSVTQPREQTPDGTILIGTDARGKSVYRSWAQLKSVLILGLAGLGKSSTASWLVAQAIRDGASIVLIDKHGRSDESLTAMLAPFKSFFVRPPAYRPDDAFKNAQFVSQDLESRIEGDTPCDVPLVLVIDEFSDIMRQIKQGGHWKETGQELAALIEEINTQGRKYNVFVIAIGQITNASRSGGTEIRDLFNTRMLHAMRETQAQMVLPEYKQQVARLEKGQIFLDMEGRDEPFMVQVPLLSEKEMMAIASHCQERMMEQLDADERYDDRDDEYDDSEQDPLPSVPSERVVKYEPMKRAARYESEDDRKVSQALQYWQKGHASVRKLEAVSGWSNGETRRIIRLMREQGLVE